MFARLLLLLTINLEQITFQKPQSSGNGKGCGWGKLKTYTAGGSGGCLSGHLALERQRALLGIMRCSLSRLDGSFSKRLGSRCGHISSKLSDKLRSKADSTFTICNLANKYLRKSRAKQR